MFQQARFILPGYPHHVVQRGNRRQGKLGTRTNRLPLIPDGIRDLANARSTVSVS